MVDGHDGDAVVGQIAQQLRDEQLRPAVEAESELVREEDGRSPEERLGDRELPLLAAGEESGARLQPLLELRDDGEDVVERSENASDVRWVR